MALSTTFIIMATLIVAIWLIIEVKRMKHKLFAIFLIGLIILAYLGFVITLSKQDIDYTSTSGLSYAGKIYFSWFSGIFSKMKSITGYAIGLDWSEEFPTSDTNQTETNKTNTELEKINTEVIKEEVKDKVEEVAVSVWDKF